MPPSEGQGMNLKFLRPTQYYEFFQEVLPFDHRLNRSSLTFEREDGHVYERQSSRTFKFDSSKWIQRTSLSLRPFIRSK